MPKLKHLLISLIASASLFIIFSGSTHAATIDVAAGTDAVDDNSVCQLSEAIANINDGAQTHDDCVETGVYGTDDTINLPTGTITLTADNPEISVPITVIGQGVNSSIIDGDGLYFGIGVNNNATLEHFKVIGFGGFAITVLSDTDNLVSIRNIEINGTGATPDGGGNVIGGILGGAGQLNIEDVYIHDISGDSVNSLFGINVHAVNSVELGVDISNTTISDFSTSDSQTIAIGFLTGIFDNSLTPGTIDATITNTTMTDFEAGTGSAVGITNFPAVNGGDSLISLDIKNSTISRLSGAGATTAFDSTNIGAGGVTFGADDTSTVEITSTNNILAGDVDSCIAAGDVGPDLGMGSSSGTLVQTFTSTGGNLSDDNSCSSYFTEPSDQNNLTGLGSTLSALADNGGYIPTMALKQGSPAIDSGITIPTLTTDARGELRPQGNAYDSGAYESPYTLVNEVEDSEVDNLAETGERVLPIIVLATLLIFTSSTSVIWRIKQRT